jgi:hypothetical protein
VRKRVVKHSVKRAPIDGQRAGAIDMRSSHVTVLYHDSSIDTLGALVSPDPTYITI